jgi:predicted NAD/FAD-binding protein
MHIAVIGAGIAGNTAAWSLSKRHRVTVYETELRAGGHSHTVTVDYDGAKLAVDIGFIIFNQLNYPELTALFAELDVETIATEMSFAVTADDGRFEWKGDSGNLLQVLGGLFVQPQNLLSPSFLRMLRDVQRFGVESVADYSAGKLAGVTLGDYCASHKFELRLLTDYLAPMGAAIWSTPAGRIVDFPAENFVAFFDNHRLLQYERPTWRTVKDGSQRYVEKLTSSFRDQIRFGCSVTSIVRTPEGVVVNDSHGGRESYDQVVIASHSDQALAMLPDADDRERAVLGGIRYAPNEIFLHRDTRLMPKRRRAWASWNFLRWQGTDVAARGDAITYWMNPLQGIEASKPLFVSLNPPFEPDPALTFGKYTKAHPQYDTLAFAAQKRLGEIQGRRKTWFCGAWTGYGFHEDGLRSARQVAQELGASVPWYPPSPPASDKN